jgi:hypothetical protein
MTVTNPLGLTPRFYSGKMNKGKDHQFARSYLTHKNTPQNIKWSFMK